MFSVGEVSVLCLYASCHLVMFFRDFFSVLFSTERDRERDRVLIAFAFWLLFYIACCELALLEV